MLLRIEPCRPPGQYRSAGRPPRRGPGGTAPAATRRSPPEVRVIRQRSCRSPPATGRPARRCGHERRDRRRDPDGGTTARSWDAAGRAGWDAGSGPRQCRSGPDPVRPARGRRPGACRARAAGPVREAVRAGRCRRPGGRHASRRREPTPGDRAAAGPAAGPGAPLLAAAGGLRPGPRLPRLRPAGPRRPRPGGAGARRPRPAVPRRALARAGLRARLLRAAAVLDRRLRRAAARGWRWPVARRCTWRCWAAPPRSPPGCRWLAALDRRALGGRRGAARPVRPRRLPVGSARVQPDRRARCSSLAAYGGVPLVSFAVALDRARCWPRPYRRCTARGAAHVPGEPGRRPLRAAVLSRGRRPGRPAGRRAGLAAAARPVADRRRPDGHGRGDPGQRAAARAWSSTPSGGRCSTTTCSRPSSSPTTSPRARSPQPDLVLWPENSSDIDPYRNADAAGQIDRAAAGHRRADPGRRRRRRARAGSSATPRIVWDPVTGPGADVRQAAPGAAGRVRAGADASSASSAARSTWCATDFVGGTTAGRPVDAGGARLGDLICFEVVYDGLVRDVVDGGAGMLVVQTNNATFGCTDESAQQLAMSRLRAVEFGRTVAVAATSGISAIVAPDGSVVRAVGAVHPRDLRRADRPAGLHHGGPAAGRRPGVGADRAGGRRRCSSPCGPGAAATAVRDRRATGTHG